MRGDSRHPLLACQVILRKARRSLSTSKDGLQMYIDAIPPKWRLVKKFAFWLHSWHIVLSVGTIWG
jgi:hypothetical protein